MSETIAGKAGKKRNSLEKSAFNMAMTISLLLLAAVFIIDYMAFSRAADEYYQNAGITLTKMVADTLDSDSVRQMTEEALAAYEGSGYEGVNPAGQSLREVLEILNIRRVIICGIATEFCVYNTARDLQNAGFKVSVLKDCIAYVEKEGHLKTLKTMEEEGIELRYE